MVFGIKESSRHRGNPAKLFLFKGSDPMLESLMRSVTIIPGATEFGYGTTLVTDSVSGQPKNRYAGQAVSDFTSSLEDLLASAPHLEHVSLVVAWHGTDLRCGNCEIRPKVETASGSTAPYVWKVGDLVRGTAQVVSQISGKPAYGGAPSDRTIYEAIVALKAAGLKVTLYPFVMMDIAAGNGLPDPYGEAAQAAYPWRGRITCHPAVGEAGTVDATSAATTQANAFFGGSTAGDFSWNAGELRVNYSGAAEWKFNRFILHMATIANAAGVDDFLIGSELVGLTTIRNEVFAYPAVTKLKTLAAAARTILGGAVKISYAADWSEFHSHKVGTDLRFHLDSLWSDINIDYVGIDNYFPAADWREGFTHLDWLAGFNSIHDPNYIKSNIEGGEYFDWFYASDAARTAQTRSPITDGAHNEPWVYRQKDIRGWWSNTHHERIAGVRQVSATPWVPELKPIVFTEIGCGAIDKGPNQPNVFLDPKSSESVVPYFSNGRPDAAVMRAFLEATLDYWHPNNGKNEGMIDYDKISLWTWDARPYPVFPTRTDYYGDAGNWVTGHWLTGRIAPGRAFEHGTFGPYAFTNAETAIVRAGITYAPWAIKHSEISTTGTLDKSDLTITMAAGSGLEDEFIGYPPSQVINLTIFQGQMDDTPTLVDYPAQWLGRITAPEFNSHEIAFNAVPVSTSIQRPGLRRNYQLGCPHVLYGSQCRANKSAATVTRTVSAIIRNRVQFGAAIGGGGIDPARYISGLLEWTAANGRKETRTIAKAEAGGLEVTIRGSTRGLAVAMSVSVVLGCRRNMTDCNTLHENILNFGGQPLIPLENPLSQKNQFY